MVSLGQYVIAGLGYGAIYALVALGLVLIFKTTGVINFAAGAMGTAVTMVLWTVLAQLNLPFIVAWLVALVAALLIGALTETVFLRRIHGSPLLIQIVLTLGLLLVIEGLVGWIWGYELKTVPPVVPGGPANLGPWFVLPNEIFIIVLSLILTAVFFYIFERTRVGLAMRAVAQNPDVASLMGIHTFRYVTASWAIGVLVTGIGTILLAPLVSLSPTMMDDVAVFAFAAAVLGGFGSLAGAVAGGFIIGIVTDLIGAYISTNLEVTLIFVLIVLILYVRPQGLFGVEAKTRV